MSQLSHFRFDKISMDMDEPVYKNLFTIAMSLPEPLKSKYTEDYIWINQIKKVTGLATDKGLGVNDSQTYKFAQRSFAKSKPENTVIDLGFTFNVNVSENQIMYPYNVFRDWSYLIYDPQTAKMSLKKDYVGGLTVLQHDRIGRVFRKWVFPLCFLVEFNPEMELDYNSEEIWEIEAKFRCDYYADLIKESNV